MEHAEAPWFVAVGASGAEGLGDLEELLGALPAALPAVVLVVLHRPWDRISRLRAVLAQASAMPVIIARDGERFEPGVAYIGEPAKHLTLAARSLGELVHDPGRTHRGRTVDLLFRSVAEHGGKRVIGVVLSGSLDDGVRGLAAIHRAGGLTMVVTPHSGQPWRGMPENAVAQDGSISVIGTPCEIANAIQAAIRGAPGATGPG
ncbi:MAG: chemotaxis protein CheB [Acetobacteraceae bacterium]|nr:chemotaxis protein CheB [Acetobacteraceae bacterium]